MILILATLAWAAANGEEDGTPQPSEPHYDLEELFAQHKYEEGLTRSNVRLRANPDDPELLWRRVRFMYEIAQERVEDSTFDRRSYYKEMMTDAKRAAELAPDSVMARYWRGVATAMFGSTRGVLRSLFMANPVRQDFEAMAEHETFRYQSLDGRQQMPCEAMHSLGIFYRLVPDRTVARMLTGTRRGIDQSLVYHERALLCGSTQVQHVKELGVTQLCMANRRGDEALRTQGLATLGRALAMPAQSPRDEVDHRHIARLQADPSLACGYLRDGQQEVESP